MNKNVALHKIGNAINIGYPLIVSVAFLIICLKFDINFKIKGFENVLESVITFSSIVIGFYTAMYGILLTLSNTNLMKEFRNRRIDKIFKFQLYDSLITSFIVLIFSIVLQILKHYPSKAATIIFILWFTFIGYFIATTYRSISLLLRIFFTREVKLPNTNPKSEKDKLDQIKRIQDRNRDA